ncbi:MAG: Lrp/AsnC ligand binding domain-containing protein [Candidatus Thorarchaeota archaeon]
MTKIDGVSRADVVTGPYDIIVYAELPSNQDLRLLMKSIHEIEGITRTETCVAI